MEHTVTKEQAAAVLEGLDPDIEPNVIVNVVVCMLRPSVLIRNL